MSINFQNVCGEYFEKIDIISLLFRKFYQLFKFDLKFVSQALKGS